MVYLTFKMSISYIYNHKTAIARKKIQLLELKRPSKMTQPNLPISQMSKVGAERRRDMIFVKLGG